MKSNDSAPTRPPSPAPYRLGLRVIAAYKAVKALGLLLMAAASFHLYHTRNFERLVDWLAHLSLSDSNGLRWRLVHALEAMGPDRFVAIGLVALGYALMFDIEAVGLWLRKYWAEWFTVIATGSLVPLEIYELIRHFTGLKLAVMIINVVVVIYLARVAMQSRAERGG